MPKRFKIQEDLNTEFTLCGVQDSDGKEFQITDAVKDNAPSKIRVVLEATHTGVNKNKVEYTHFGLEESVGSWTDNYQKPVLLNHSTYSDPLGRVIHAEYKQSVIDASKNCIQLTLEISNSGAIERFLDGRYKTFSIGGYTDSAKCSICGKDQMKDGWCGHSRGRKYDDKECYWTLGKMEYDEISVVNCPADPNAQALSIEVVNTDTTKDNTDGVAKAPTEDSTNITDDTTGTTHVTDEFNLSQVDDMLATGDTEDSTVDTTDEEPKGDDTEGAKTGDSATGEGAATNTEVTVQDLQEEIARLSTDIIVKDQAVASLTAEVEELKADVVTREADSVNIKLQLDAADKDAKGLAQQNVGLAKLVHKVMCGRAIDVQVALGDAKEEDRETLMKEYTTYTTQKLEDMASELLSKPKITEKVKVQHPGAGQINDETVDSTSASGDGKDEEPTLDEYIDEVTRFFVGKM